MSEPERLPTLSRILSSNGNHTENQGNKHTQPYITTGPIHSSPPHSTPPLLSPSLQPYTPQRSQSPINRKRAEGKDEDHHETQLTAAVEDAGHSTLPPLKRPKPSLSLSQANLTEYRSSQDMADDPLSPLTSPVIEPTSPATSVSSHNSRRHRRSSSAAGTLAGIPLIPLLTRSSTLEEIKPNLQPLEGSSSETAIGNLSLGTRTGGTTSRASGLERAMGVITTSRQGSPALSTAESATKEPALVHMEEEVVHHRRSQNASQLGEGGSSTAWGDRHNAEDAHMQGIHVEIYDDFDEEDDVDYELAADTTVDENHSRVDTSESEDDDSFSCIDIRNIESAGDDIALGNAPYHDIDPTCQDRFDEVEKAQIMDEAREHGIGYIIERYIITGACTVKKLLLMTSEDELKFAPNLSEADLICILTQRLQRELRHRRRLHHIHTLEHVIHLLKSSKKIMVLTGAGVSVSCGIPDFRSPDGIYLRLSEFELEDPTQMFELEFFCEKPQVFYSFAREIFPSNFTPSPSHAFIKLLEEQGRLLRNYTQNIDTLEQKTGIKNVLQCHGSFATASCVRCKRQVPGDDIKEDILNQRIAYCTVCQSSASKSQPGNSSQQALSTNSSLEESDGEEGPAVMKPDIVFFGERLPTAFDDNFDADRGEVDLLIVIGSSLKVAPVSDIMHQLPKTVPQILINRTPITHMEFDVQLLGNCDTIVAELCRMAGWELKHKLLAGGTSNVPDMDTNTNADGSGKGGRAYWSVIEPNTYLFEGAILGDIEYESSQSSSKKRTWLDHGGAEHYDADTDEEGGSQRRPSFSRVDRFTSPGLMDTDSDSDSGYSQHTVRDIAVVALSNTSGSSAVDLSWTSSGIAGCTTEPHSSSIPDIDPSQSLPPSQQPSLQDKSSNHEGVLPSSESDDELAMHIILAEEIPRDLEVTEPMTESEPHQDDPFDTRTRAHAQSHEDGQEDHHQDVNLESIVENPLETASRVQVASPP
ncbi:NAD-dependent histone deacetylase sir2 [Mortierella claussenii]|nr:NAD-dependent histone deacetylase sir2 [Mortierella claussenii]